MIPGDGLSTSLDDNPDTERTIPLVEERMRVTKATVRTGSVRVSSHVISQEVQINEILEQRRVRVERVAVDHLVEKPPPLKTRGDRTIISVTEEVMVKRYRVVEEIHLIEEREDVAFDQKATLKRTSIEITRQ